MAEGQDQERFQEMERHFNKLIKSVRNNNYMLLQTATDDGEYTRSQVVPVSNFDAFIHKRSLQSVTSETSLLKTI